MARSGTVGFFAEPRGLISRKLTPVTNRGRRDRRSTGIPETVLLHTGTG